MMPLRWKSILTIVLALWFAGFAPVEGRAEDGVFWTQTAGTRTKTVVRGGKEIYRKTWRKPGASDSRLEERLVAQQRTIETLVKRVASLESAGVSGGDRATPVAVRPSPAAATADGVTKPEGGNALAALRAAAEAEAGPDDSKGKASEETTFKSGGLSLQALNPEISVTGEFAYLYTGRRGLERKNDFLFRGLGLHLESYLDPYTRFKAAVPVMEGAAVLGEAYLTRFGFAKRLNLTLGKFRQQFGLINRWHKHGLDQWDFPLALRQIFGEGGLNQVGLSLDWTMPSGGRINHEAVLQVTDGQNDRLFAENTKNKPSLLFRYRNYRDVSRDSYFEFGLSALVGWNDTWALAAGGTLADDLVCRSYALDWTWLWEPTGKMRHRNRLWRSEIYLLEKDILPPTGGLSDTLRAWGGYSYLQQKISRTTEIGLRYDHYVPDVKAYGGGGLSPLAVTSAGARQRGVSPYLTWWQSPFVRYHIEFNKIDNRDMGIPDEKRVIFQVVFAAGPHKHERY